MRTKFSKEIFTNSQFLPVGAVVDFTQSTPPEGFLNCNGAAVSRKTYAKLFAVIGTKYGAGDGSSTFNLPDFRGRFAEGGESDVGTIKLPGLPNITGGVRVNANEMFREDPVVTGAFTKTRQTMWRAGYTNTQEATRPSGFNFDASRCSVVYGRSTVVQPASIVVNKCIKY